MMQPVNLASHAFLIFASGDAIVDALVGAFSPAGRLPATMYTPNIIARDIRDVDLASSGGITHTWFSGPVLFPFGFGLSYAQFGFEMQFLGEDALKWSVALDSNGKIITRCDEEKTLRVRVSNSGSSSVSSDCAVLVFIQRSDDASSVSPSSASPAPREALVAFQRLRSLAPGVSAVHDFKLHFNAVFSAFRDEWGNVMPPRETYALRIGHSSSESDARLSVTVY